MSQNLQNDATHAMDRKSDGVEFDSAARESTVIYPTLACLHLSDLSVAQTSSKYDQVRSRTFHEGPIKECTEAAIPEIHAHLSLWTPSSACMHASTPFGRGVASGGSQRTLLPLFPWNWASHDQHGKASLSSSRKRVEEICTGAAMCLEAMPHNVVSDILAVRLLSPRIYLLELFFSPHCGVNTWRTNFASAEVGLCAS
jgi:hypothetical protein